MRWGVVVQQWVQPHILQHGVSIINPVCLTVFLDMLLSSFIPTLLERVENKYQAQQLVFGGACVSSPWLLRVV